MGTRRTYMMLARTIWLSIKELITRRSHFDPTMFDVNNPLSMSDLPPFSITESYTWDTVRAFVGVLMGVLAIHLITLHGAAAVYGFILLLMTVMLFIAATFCMTQINKQVNDRLRAYSQKVACSLDKSNTLTDALHEIVPMQFSGKELPMLFMGVHCGGKFVEQGTTPYTPVYGVPLMYHTADAEVPDDICVMYDGKHIVVFEHIVQEGYVLNFTIGFDPKVMWASSFLALWAARDVLMRIMERMVAKKRLNETGVTSDATKLMEDYVKATISSGEYYDIGGIFKPRHEVGGDVFTLFHHDGTTDFSVFDISGKGLKAAIYGPLVAYLSRTAFREYPHLKHAANTFINNIAPQLSFAEMFLTGIMGKLTERGVFYYNFGHPPMVMYSKEQNEVLIVNDEKLRLPVIGVIDLNIWDDATFIEMQSGDVLVAFSDGAIDNKILVAEDKYLDDRVIAYGLEQSSGLSAQEIADRIYEAIFEYIGDYTQLKDDVTILVFKKK